MESVDGRDSGRHGGDDMDRSDSDGNLTMKNRDQNRRSDSGGQRRVRT